MKLTPAGTAWQHLTILPLAIDVCLDAFVKCSFAKLFELYTDQPEVRAHPPAIVESRPVQGLPSVPPDTPQLGARRQSSDTGSCFERGYRHVSA